MASVAARPAAVFGCRPGVPGGVCFLQERLVLHAAGAACAQFHTEHRRHEFIPGRENSRGVRALAVSRSRRYLAVSESAAEEPALTVYELTEGPPRRRRTLTAAELPAREAVSLAFSPDGRHLAAATGPPEVHLALWLWEKRQLLAAVHVEDAGSGVCQVSFSPQDNARVCITGNGFFKLFKYSKGALKQVNLQKGEPQNYLCHAWLSEEEIICGTATGKLLLFESGELLWQTDVEYRKPPKKLEEGARTKDYASCFDVPCEPTSEDGDSLQDSLPQISAVASYSKGFACSSSPGVVLLFEKTNKKEVYEESQEIWLPQDLFTTVPKPSGRQDIICICFSPSEEAMVVSTTKNQLYMFTMPSTDFLKEETSHFEYLHFPLHSASITGLDICIWKPIVATCSLDKSVRVWNYKTNTLELYKEFWEEAYTVALHPTGLFCLVGFSDKLRFISLLYEDMHVFKDFPVRKCGECSFSNGGHLFAAVNGNVIQMYSCTSFENTNNLKGHSGKICAVKWSADDSKCFSCDTHGAVYGWNLSTGKREFECVLTSCVYSSIALHSNSKIIFAVGSDQTLKEISESSIQLEVPAFDVVYTAVAVSHSGDMVFVGTSLGTVRAMKYPLPLSREFNEYQAHAGAVTKMSVTNDDLFLLTASEDGSIFFWKLYKKEGVLKREKEFEYAKEVLILKSDIEEKSRAMLELQIHIKELQTENDYQLRLKDMSCYEKIEELEETFTQEIDSLKNKHQILQAEKDNQELQHQFQLSELMNKHAKEMRDLESDSNQKLLMENEKYQELQVNSQRMQEEYEKQLHNLQESKSRAVEELTDYYEDKLNEKTLLLEEAEEDMRQQLKAHEEIKKQIEEDEDQEIQEIKIKYERRLAEEKESNLQLKGEIGVMNKRLSSLQKELKERNSGIEEMKLEQQNLQGIIKSLEKEITTLNTQIEKRTNTIQEKEKHLYDLKMKNQELEKLKFVLDHRIEQFRKQIESRENDGKIMKEQIHEMERELKQFHEENMQLKLNITQLQQKLKATNNEMHKERQKKQNMEALIKRFKTDLHNCVGFIQDYKKLKAGIHELHTKYVQQLEMVEMEEVDTDLQQEYMRQREYLERNLAALKKKVVKDQEIHQVAYRRIMRENVSLIKEINDLRQELTVAHSQVHDLQSALRLTKKKQAIQDTAPSSEMLSSPAVLRLNAQKENEKIIEMQMLEIQRLRDRIQEKEQSLEVLPLLHGVLPKLNLERSHKTNQH